MANEEGRNIGIKVSAYNQIDDAPMQSIEFSYQEYGYLTAPVLYEQRQHLLLNKSLNIIGFIAYEYYETTRAKVLLFHVDFSQEKPLSLNPLFEMDLKTNPDKLILINHFIHILSNEGILTFHLLDNTLMPFIPFVVDRTK